VSELRSFPVCAPVESLDGGLIAIPAPLPPP